MSFFGKLRDRLFKSSSKIEDGLEAIVEDGGEEEPVAPQEIPEPAPEPAPAVEPAPETPPLETPPPAEAPDSQPSVSMSAAAPATAIAASEPVPAHSFGEQTAPDPDYPPESMPADQHPGASSLNNPSSYQEVVELFASRREGILHAAPSGRRSQRCPVAG